MHGVGVHVSCVDNTPGAAAGVDFGRRQWKRQRDAEVAELHLGISAVCYHKHVIVRIVLYEIVSGRPCSAASWYMTGKPKRGKRQPIRE